MLKRMPDSRTTGHQAVPDFEPLLTAAEVAAILNVRRKRVYELGLPAVQVSPRCLRWRPADVLAFIERRRVA